MRFTNSNDLLCKHSRVSILPCVGRENTVKLWSAATRRRVEMASPTEQSEGSDELPHSTGWGGKLAIVVILMVALCMAGYAWWYRYQQGREARAFWGREATLLIGQARQVELLRLRPADESAADSESERVDIAGRAFAIVERIDVSRARGLLHARDALIDDDSFVWDQPRGNGESQWEFAFRFSDGQQHATVTLDFACRRVLLIEGEQEATIVALTANGLRELVDREYVASAEE